MPAAGSRVRERVLQCETFALPDFRLPRLFAPEQMVCDMLNFTPEIAAWYNQAEQLGVGTVVVTTFLCIVIMF